MSRSDRFISNPNEIYVVTRDSVLQRLKEWSNALPSDIGQLNSIQKQEFFMNSTYKLAWQNATSVYEKKKTISSLKAVHQNAPKELHIALIAYTLESPKMYADFNGKTRQLKDEAGWKAYRYKSFFKFLELAIQTLNGHPDSASYKLYRGCSGKISKKEGEWIAFHHFLSTTYDKNTGLMFTPGGGTLFVLGGVAGDGCIGLGHHSIFDEKEYLVWPFQGYKIYSVTEEGGMFSKKYTHVNLNAQNIDAIS